MAFIHFISYFVLDLQPQNALLCLLSYMYNVCISFVCFQDLGEYLQCLHGAKYLSTNVTKSGKEKIVVNHISKNRKHIIHS